MNMYIRRKEAFLIHIGCWGVFRDVDKLMQNLIPLAKCNLALRKFRKGKRTLEERGIDPRTSSMLTMRSTI